jgi:hypothetical protein
VGPDIQFIGLAPNIEAGTGQRETDDDSEYVLVDDVPAGVESQEEYYNNVLLEELSDDES